jgi:hypothetical protein
LFKITPLFLVPSSDLFSIKKYQVSPQNFMAFYLEA